MYVLPRGYVHRVTVSDTDIDMLEHVSNLVYPRWIQEGALAHCESLGFDFEAFKQTGGVFVLSRHEIDYLRPAFRGEDLEMRTYVATMSAVQSVRDSVIVRLSDDATLVKSRTIWCYVALENGKPMRIPEEMATRFGDPPRKLPSAV
jgi:acyl-CoA thioester hydrolase